MHSQFRVLSAVVVHPQAQEELFIPHGVRLFLSRTGILGFTHVIFFCGLVDGAAVSLPHELNYGFGVDCYSCPGRNSVNFFYRMVCVSLPVALLS